MYKNRLLYFSSSMYLSKKFAFFVEKINTKTTLSTFGSIIFPMIPSAYTNGHTRTRTHTRTHTPTASISVVLMSRFFVIIRCPCRKKIGFRLTAVLRFFFRCFLSPHFRILFFLITVDRAKFTHSPCKYVIAYSHCCHNHELARCQQG